jgi:hypothetical protein
LPADITDLGPDAKATTFLEDQKAAAFAEKFLGCHSVVTRGL